LVKLAKADAFYPSLRQVRRDAFWAIKALRDEPLPLFAAASARSRTWCRKSMNPISALSP
jgi:error-prone DNA polymerase